jgi:hypothetical protein
MVITLIEVCWNDMMSLMRGFVFARFTMWFVVQLVRYLVRSAFGFELV